MSHAICCYVNVGCANELRVTSIIFCSELHVEEWPLYIVMSSSQNIFVLL